MDTPKSMTIPAEDETEKIRNAEFTTADGEPITPFYCFFCCCKKRVLLGKPLYKYYDVIFGYAYRTDGRLYEGRYDEKTKSIDWDSDDPDIRYCYPCRIIQLLCCAPYLLSWEN